MTRATPQARATSKDDCAWISATPSPWLAPRYSPITAPSRAAGAATRSPAKTLGSAPGTRTMRKTRQAPPPVERTTSTLTASMVRRPRTVATRVVKKTDSAASATLGPSPDRTTTNIGAIATSGMQ